MLIRRLFFLVVAIALGHAALFHGRRLALTALARSYGSVGIDQQGRVRHWEPQLGPSTRILSADEVERVGLREGRLVTIAGMWARYDLKSRESERARRIRKHTLASRMLMAFPYYDGDAGLALRVDDDGRATLGVTRRVDPQRRGGTTTYGVETVRSIPLDGDFKQVDLRFSTTFDHMSVSVLNNEYWIIDREGGFVQRQPLGHDVSRAKGRGPSNRSAVCSFLLPGKSFRPDRTPMRLIVARPGHEVLDRVVVLEPATAEQRWIAASFCLMGALRPFPLQLASMAAAEPTDPRTLYEQWWIDPIFAEGANTGWLVVGVCVLALCAWVAYRWGRMRLVATSRRLFWIASVVVLGPMGLLWMRLSIPWVAIEGGRAVNIESPDWPVPEHSGAEVFA